MKRTIALILALLLAASVFSCADETDKPVETNADAAVTTAAETEAETTAASTPELELPDVGATLDKTAIILEYMSWLSSQTLIPAYYETTILDKSFRDEDAAKMLDIVRATTHYEVTSMCGITLDNILMTAEKKGNLMSLWKKAESSVKTKLQKFAEKYAGIGA